MLKSLLDIFCCPACRGKLSLTAFDQDETRVHEGVFTCAACATVYPVTGDIPRFVPAYVRHDPEFFSRHGLDPERMLRAWSDDRPDVAKIQAQTQTNFGHEWDYYASLGWTDDTGVDASDKAESELWFHAKTLLETPEVAGKLILDAGCGNGRFSRVALEYSPRMVSIDLTSAADVAYKNLSGCGFAPMVVQGDLLHPPFRQGAFEVVFTIGVIQHTGRALEATEKLAGLVRKGGLLAVRTYLRGNARLEENDAALRAVTTTFSLKELHELSDILAQLTDFLERKGLYAQVARHVNLFHKRYDIFDWYSAPVAEKLTYEELRAVFAKCGLTEVRDMDDGTTPEQRAFSAISIVGRRD